MTSDDGDLAAAALSVDQRGAFVDDDQDRTQLRTGSGSTGEIQADLAPKVLKSRFVLDEPLGSGGMGTVYRAKDLRKVEAQDRNPFLAIKVLNSDFREHPDAFIALQRESAKSQSLSHPNIVSIFDFDKDGDLPFMTMELLQGEELATMLKRYPEGLPRAVAWTVLDGFLSALQHAHGEGLIHADLKPSNVFVTASNHAKVLDFGLARAVQANLSQGVLYTRGDVHDQVFDPAALGALTPAFASLAMLDGAKPGPADDVFAAALVVYQVLTGRHPYNRVPANRVAPNGEALERPKNLRSRQWRVLQSALALRQEERLGSIAALRAGLFETPTWPLRLLVGGFFAAALAIGGVYLLKENEIQVVQQQATEAATTEERVDRLVELVREPTFDAAWEQQLAAEFERINELENAAQLQLQARTQIATLYENRIKTTPDLAAAANLLERGRAYGGMIAAQEDLKRRIHDRLNSQLDEQKRDVQWVNNVASSLAQLPIDTHLGAIAEVEVNSLYLRLLEEFAEAGDARREQDTVDALLDHLHAREFDSDAVRQAQAALIEQSTAARAAELAAQQRATAAQEVDDFVAEIAPLGCMVSELPALEQEYKRLLATQGVSQRALRRQLDAALYDCVIQLQPIEPDAAVDLLTESIKYFGVLPRLNNIRVDPCDRQYLIGAGARTGRGAYCTDRLSQDASAPQMIVIPPAGTAAAVQKFAISKYEISWREFGPFCKAAGLAGCIDEPNRVVSSVSIDQARAFADWISASSGYKYRLPSLGEFSRAMALDSASTQQQGAGLNCVFELGGVVRGGTLLAQKTGTANALGVVNGFGNIQEWVEDERSIYAVGGHYNDALARCDITNQRLVTGEPDGLTGFRLVREITTPDAIPQAYVR